MRFFRITVLFFFAFIASVVHVTADMWTIEELYFQQDSIIKDTTYIPGTRPTYQPQYRFGDSFSFRPSGSPLLLKDPTQLEYNVEYDSGFRYSLTEQIGQLPFVPPTYMSFEDYDRLSTSQITRNYWKEQLAQSDGNESPLTGKRLIPRLYISPVFDRIFGGSYVDIQPTGFVNLDFGGMWQFVDNQQVPERQRRNGGFNFDMQISTNVVGKIGEKMAVTFNYDNNNTFDFQNDMKIEYTGFEEDIIKKIELGNVSMPVSNSLISGAQALFGIKTQLQFGRLYVTGIASRQRGRTDAIVLENGNNEQNFEIRASNYDENRHFFIGHFFRDNYENWLRNLPQVVSGVNITRVEVYVLNRNNDTQTTRNFLALADLGESRRIYNPQIMALVGSDQPTSNGANTLFSTIKGSSIFRERDLANGALESQLGMIESSDFVKVTTARKLDLTEYRINRDLGIISLSRKLQNDEVLAVSYEYTFNGRVYKVGELTEDYQNISEDKLIFLKLLRPNLINFRVPMWDLMMKNIYNLNTSQLVREGFSMRVHYRDDRTGIDNPSLHESSIKDVPLLQVLKLDQLNLNNDRQQDGNFDYIEGLTVDSQNGLIIFPVLEPFGKTLRDVFTANNETTIIEKYVYDTLYRTTRADAELVASKNKFFLVGKYSGGSGSEITLPGFNISPNSVVVRAGGTPLSEGVDYTVDYNLGRVRIINQSILSSGKQISISFEKSDVFNFQSRWLTGAQFDYLLNDKISFGATVLHLNERPGGITRYQIGTEPTKNTQYGFNFNYQQDSRLLTQIIDLLPLVSTKETSTISLAGEVAALRPGTSNIVEGKGTSYIDDFENAAIPVGLGGFVGWKPAATPFTPDNKFDKSSESGSSLGVNFKRAKLSWYTVDNSVFYAASGNARPSNIREEDLENHYVKAVLPQDIYQQRDRQVINLPESVLDLAYFPSERGMYNYSTDLTSNGELRNPRQNWAGVTRAITNEVDFDKNNIEYLEFWLMDPFIEGENGRILDGVRNQNNTTGGKLIFNLGSVSEDFIRDGRHSFENGLDATGDLANNTANEWGYVPSEQFLTQFFENEADARENQDVGLDGLKNDQERILFEEEFISKLNISPTALEQIIQDPSADDFQYYLGESLDGADAKILERYKNYNGLDGNSPIATRGLTRGYTPDPDNEDLNKDNTISTLEEYFEYELDLRPGDLSVGSGYVVDQVVDRSGEATWYLLRIPIRTPTRVIGGIQGFKTIRYVRMYMTDWQQSAVLRMAKLQLVGSPWRKFTESLAEVGLNEIPETSTSDFTISVVNIEENGIGDDETSPYVVPPGLQRDRDNTTVLNRRLPEQSLQICVANLEDGDARAVYKNVSYDLINYGRLKMFFHAENFRSNDLENGQLTAFLRFGTDFSENYYEIELPLNITPKGIQLSGEALQRAVWPLENEIDISINELLGLKSERNRLNINNQLPYSTLTNDKKYKITIKGRPDMSTLLTMMIGVRNPQSDDRQAKSVCLWANELRVTDFDTDAGWAGNARLAMKLADLGQFSASTRYTSIGYGSLQQRIAERSRAETFQYDLNATINIDKFLRPDKTGLRIPMFVSYEESRITPQFDPLDPDVPLEASLESIDIDEERESYRRIVEDRSTRRSLNFTNVRKEKTKKDTKSHFYDISNLSLNYSFSDQVTSNVNTQALKRKNQAGGIAYTYNPKAINFSPFSKSEALKNPYFKILKDFNFSPVPNSFSARGDLNRSFMMTQLYNDRLTTENIAPFYERLFTFNRSYNLRWNITNALSLDYAARANAIIDEPDSIISGDIDSRKERDYVWNRVTSLGRMRSFSQDIAANYKLPIDKIPLFDWISGDIRYSTGTIWTAGSLNQNDEAGNFFGNNLQNKRDRTLNGKIDLVKLYNKSTFLKKYNTPTRPTNTKKQPETNSEKNTSSAPSYVAKIFFKTLMSIRNITGTYGIREGTTINGYVKNPFLFGLDSGFIAPGLPFILGDQDPNIRYKAAENGWITQSPSLTAPFAQTRSFDLTYRVAVEPFSDLKIQLDGKRTLNSDFREIFRYDGESAQYVSLTPSRTGGFSITTLTIRTAFEKSRNEVSPTFEKFRENIDEVYRRVDTDLSNNGVTARYDTISQDILIPAFLAAYTGTPVSQTALRPFPLFPIPNWRVDFAGLTKLPFLKDIFSTFNITHSYRSLYSIGNFSNSLLYDQDVINLDQSFFDYPLGSQADPETGELVPVYIINQVTIAEQFAPLIGVNVRTKKNLSARIDYKKDRNLSLNMANAQVAETTNNDISLDLGFTKENLKLPFRIQGRVITIQNAITFRVNTTLRDGKTIQRNLNGDNTLTAGNRNFQLRPTIAYKLNNTLDLTFYFDRSLTQPRVGSFNRAATAFGGQLRFNLAQ